MNLRLDLPPEIVEQLAAEVTARVLAELQQAPAAEPSSPLMTIAEAATYLRCNRQRIDDLLSQRRLTRVKDGTRTLIRRDEIERHLTNERSTA